ncbi:MAG: hypothetical protein M0P31_13695 [Solirubrobacteraceae bacterium]|nr:hypothetical protein [Solirubrobacteraceae bacterium]
MTDPVTDAPDAVPSSLLDRARAAYRSRTSAATNDVPVLADPDTGRPLLWLRLGVPEEAQVSLVRQMLLDQGSGRRATSAVDHARFVGACVRGLGEEDPDVRGQVITVRTAAGDDVAWVPWVAQATGMPCASPEQAIIALFTVADREGGPPRLDAQRLAEVSDLHRVAVLADTASARDEATDPGA